MAVRQTSNGKQTAVKTVEGLGPFCITASIIPDHLAEAFVSFIDRHPERLKDNALDVAADALIALDNAPPREWVAPVMWEICGRKSP
jgi:menaquinone-dependent protoporphyrinogen IX oxidase